MIGNEKIEQCIARLQKDPSEELLAAALTAVRRRMKEKGQVIVAIDPSPEKGLQIKPLCLDNGEQWLPAFTCFEEEMKGGQPVMSAFMAEIGQLIDMTLQEDSLQGIILNPWNLTLMLDKDLLRIIKG